MLNFPEVPHSEFHESDKTPCFLMATGYSNGGGLLNEYAAKKLKDDHPNLFAQYPSTPDYDDDWDELMNSNYSSLNTLDQDRYQAVAQFIHKHQELNTRPAILTVAGDHEGWHAEKTTKGHVRTSSYEIYSVSKPGEIIVIRDNEYRAKVDRDKLQQENLLLRKQLKTSEELLNQINIYLHTKGVTDATKVGKLKDILFSATETQNSKPEVSYDDLKLTSDLIIGKDYQDAKNSFEAKKQKMGFDG